MVGARAGASKSRLLRFEEVVSVQEKCETFFHYVLHNFARGRCQRYWPIGVGVLLWLTGFVDGNDDGVLPGCGEVSNVPCCLENGEEVSSVCWRELP